MTSDGIIIPVPVVAPLGFRVDRDLVREVWNCFVKPGQDAATPQSGEERMLIAILRAVYVGLPPTESEPGVDYCTEASLEIRSL